MLEGFDPNQIQDLEGARQAIVMLLNLVETLKTENQALREQNQRLRDEVNRLKGEQGKPNIKPNRQKGVSANHSSEAERRQPQKRKKRRKLDRVQIDRTEVSRCHARIVVEGTTATVEDLGSKNGTYLNGRRLLQPAVLADGDEIWIGRSVARFRFVAEGEPTATEHSMT